MRAKGQLQGSVITDDEVDALLQAHGEILTYQRTFPMVWSKLYRAALHYATTKTVVLPV